jgi:hypothetical protein
VIENFHCPGKTLETQNHIKRRKQQTGRQQTEMGVYQVPRQQTNAIFEPGPCNNITSIMIMGVITYVILLQKVVFFASYRIEYIESKHQRELRLELTDTCVVRDSCWSCDSFSSRYMRDLREAIKESWVAHHGHCQYREECHRWWVKDKCASFLKLYGYNNELEEGVSCCKDSEACIEALSSKNFPLELPSMSKDQLDRWLLGDDCMDCQYQKDAEEERRYMKHVQIVREVRDDARLWIRFQLAFQGTALLFALVQSLFGPDLAWSFLSLPWYRALFILVNGREVRISALVLDKNNYI